MQPLPPRLTGRHTSDSNTVYTIANVYIKNTQVIIVYMKNSLPRELSTTTLSQLALRVVKTSQLSPVTALHVGNEFLAIFM